MIAERYALCCGDLRVAAAAFETLAGSFGEMYGGIAAAKWLSSSHRYDLLPDLCSQPHLEEGVASVFLRYRIGCDIGRLFSVQPRFVLEHFDELSHALTHFAQRNRLDGVDVDVILRGAISSINRYVESPPKWLLNPPQRYLATAAMWVPRTTDGPDMARTFAWRVLRCMPLSEQLLALPAVAADVTQSPDAVEILAAAGTACRPFLAQVAPALADTIYGGTAAQGKRVVQVLGLLGAWSDGALPLATLLDYACENREGMYAVRLAAYHAMSCVLREGPVHAVEALLPGLLDAREHRRPEQRKSLVVLACERLVPERVTAHLRSAVDAAVQAEVLWTRGALDFIRNLIGSVARFGKASASHYRPFGVFRFAPIMQQLLIDALETVAAVVAAFALRDRPRRLSVPPLTAVCDLCDVLLPLLSPDDVYSATERFLALSAHQMGEDLFGDRAPQDWPSPYVLVNWVQGVSQTRCNFGDVVKISSASRHAVARACMEDALARGPSLVISHALLQYASGLGTTDFAKSLLPWVSQALPVRRMPLTALTTFNPTDALTAQYNFFVDFDAAAAALRILDTIAGVLMAAAPDELPSVVVDAVTRLSFLLDEDELPARETKHVEDSLRYLFALKPRLRVECRVAPRIVCDNHKDWAARERFKIDVERAARSNRRRRRFRLEIISAYAHSCDAAGTADLVRLLDDEDDEVRGAAAIGLVEFEIPSSTMDLDATTRGLILRELCGRRLVSLAVSSSNTEWCAYSSDGVELDVALLFAADHDARVRDEGEAIIGRSLDYLSPILDSIFELAESPREEVRERACRILSFCLSHGYFDESPAGRDRVFRCIEPLLSDESTAVRVAAAKTACSFVNRMHLNATAPMLPRHLAVVADIMLHESDEAATLSEGLLVGVVGVLRELDPRQPTLDAFVVKPDWHGPSFVMGTEDPYWFDPYTKRVTWRCPRNFKELV